MPLRPSADRPLAPVAPTQLAYSPSAQAAACTLPHMQRLCLRVFSELQSDQVASRTGWPVDLRPQAFCKGGTGQRMAGGGTAGWGPPSEVDALVHRLWVADVPPPTLWHFTTPNGAGGIEATQELWARPVERLHLGDFLEFRLGWRIIQATSEAMSADEDAITARIAKSVAGSSADFESRPFFQRTFVFCFTDAGNKRAVRSYFGARGYTQLLEFDRTKLLRGLRPKRGFDQPTMRLLQVQYDVESLITTTEQIIREAAAITRSDFQADPASAGVMGAVEANVARLLTDALASVALSFKRPSYGIESEWRLLVNSAPSADKFALKCKDGRGVPRTLPMRLPMLPFHL